MRDRFFQIKQYVTKHTPKAHLKPLKVGENSLKFLRFTVHIFFLLQHISVDNGSEMCDHGTSQRENMNLLKSASVKNECMKYMQNRIHI